MSSYFIQQCPVCGRPLHISATYRNQLVSCGHCRGCFAATAAAPSRCLAIGQGDSLMNRANQLLEMANRRLAAVGRS